MVSRLAVIPARGGSTRLKNKNIYPLGGKPLIRWTTEAVIKAEVFDEILISTDSDEIFAAVSDLNVKRHHRPKEDATTKATALNAMLNLMEGHQKHDIFAYFLPTCPFISPLDIREGINLLSNEVDSVVSMTEYSDTLQLACVMEDNDVVPIFDNLTSGLTNSKFIQQYHKPSGAFYISQWNTLLKNKNFFKGNIKGVIIPKERSVDINDKFDILMAETVLKMVQNK